MSDLDEYKQCAANLTRAAEDFLNLNKDADVSDNVDAASGYHEKRHIWQEALEDYISFFEKFED